MTRQRIKAAIALALMLLAVAGAQALKPQVYVADTRPKVNLETMFPKAFQDWAVDDRVSLQIVSPEVKAEQYWMYNQTIERVYVNRNGDRVMFSVAYGGDQSDATRAHQPEACYRGQGFEITASRDEVLRFGNHPLRVRQLLATRLGRIEPITYWIVVDGNIALGGTEQKLIQLSYGVRGVIPDGMLVRVSSIDADATNAYRIHQSFLGDMSRAIPVDVRSQVLGRSEGMPAQ